MCGSNNMNPSPSYTTLGDAAANTPSTAHFRRPSDSGSFIIAVQTPPGQAKSVTFEDSDTTDPEGVAHDHIPFVDDTTNRNQVRTQGPEADLVIPTTMRSHQLLPMLGLRPANKAPNAMCRCPLQG